jgi:signal transduction histidine kinase
MHQGSCHLEKRIDELLDIARGEIGLLKLQSSYIEPLELVHEVGEFMKAEALKHGQKITIESPPSMGPIYADYDRLHQVLMNIINNAFKFTPDKGTITLRVSESGKYALFEVSDSGIGMDKEPGKTYLSLMPYLLKM